MSAERDGDGGLLRYRKRAGLTVTAVQLDLDTEGFEYYKWGGSQHCKKGDWIVNNGGEIYTVDAETFANTYREASPGRFEKRTTVWAEIAGTPGTMTTKEGVTHYDSGDYLVYNEPDRQDGYAVSPERFKELYEPVE